MRWEDERYVRVYTRDTIAWKKLPWQARALMPLLLRVVDRAGIVDHDGYGAEGLAELIMMPVEVVDHGLRALLADGTVEERGTCLVVRNFLDAQEIPMSDAQRKREQRARDRAAARALEAPVTPVTNVTPVTDGHETSRLGHSVPCLAVPSVPSVSPSEGVAAAPPAAQAGFALDEPEPEDPSAGAQREMAEAVTHYQRRWVEVFRPDDGLPPKLSQGDRGQLRGMLKAHGMATWKDYLERYLADPDPKLATDGYALALMTRRLNGYRVAVRPIKPNPFAPSASFTTAGDKTSEYT